MCIRIHSSVLCVWLFQGIAAKACRMNEICFSELLHLSCAVESSCLNQTATTLGLWRDYLFCASMKGSCGSTAALPYGTLVLPYLLCSLQFKAQFALEINIENPQLKKWFAMVVLGTNMCIGRACTVF